MDIDIRKKLRKFLLILLVTIFGIISATWLWHYLRNGTIIVDTTNKSEVIVIERLNKNDNGEIKVAEGSGGTLTVKVPAGTYRIKAGGKMMSSSKTIELKARKTEYHTLKPPVIKSLEPVAPISAENLGVYGREIFYITPRGILHKLSSGNLGEDLSNVQLARVQWGSRGYGVGQDLKGNLYSINNGVLTPLNLPEKTNESTSINYAVAKNNMLYIAIGANIYTRTENTAYKKIHTASIQSPQLSASSNKVAVFSPPPTGEGHTEEAEDQEPFIEIVNSQGERIAKENIPSFYISWSPDGQKLISVDYFGEDRLLDSQLKQLATLPDDDVQKMTWLDNQTVFYSTEGILWSYTPENNNARILSFLPAGNTITDVVTNEESSYVYLQTSSEEKKILQRVGLKNQSVSAELQQLGTLLPTRLGGCIVSYLNLFEPTILVSSDSDINPQSCIVAAQEKLSQSNSKPEAFKYLQYAQHDH